MNEMYTTWMFSKIDMHDTPLFFRWPEKRREEGEGDQKQILSAHPAKIGGGGGSLGMFLHFTIPRFPEGGELSILPRRRGGGKKEKEGRKKKLIEIVV